MELFHRVAKHPDIFPQIGSYKAALCSLQPIVTAENKSVDDLLTAFFKRFSARELFRNAAAARDYGFAILEVTEWEEVKGYVFPVKVELCPPEWFRFSRERAPLLQSNAQPNGIDILTTWPDRFIVCQNEATLTNPYGVGLLDVAFWIAVGLNGNFEFMMQFAEDDGRDKWIGKYQPGAKQEEINDLLSKLVALRNNGVMAIPEGMSAEPQAMTGRQSSNDLYRNIDEMLRRKVEKLWTGTDLTMQVDGKGGYASSESGLMIREDALEEGKTLALSAVRQLVRIICGVNNLPEVPEVTLQMPRALSKYIADTDAVYFGAGLKPTKELFKKRGYAEEDFFIEAPAGTGEAKNADFSALPEEVEPLISAFDAYREAIKKKD
ncbi:MAG: DUF935 domain-containing protein [Culturomica sp.]|nr:DUF935 domain-containing protein [Culturomica sp.]